MRMNFIAGGILLMMLNGISPDIQAQDRLYKNTFPLLTMWMFSPSGTLKLRVEDVQLTTLL